MEKDRGEQDNPAEGEQTGHVRWGERRYREDSPGPAPPAVLAWHAAAPSHAPVSSYLEISAFRDYLRGLNNSLVLFLIHLAHGSFPHLTLAGQSSKAPTPLHLSEVVSSPRSLTYRCLFSSVHPAFSGPRGVLDMQGILSKTCEGLQCHHWPRASLHRLCPMFSNASRTV